MSKKCQKNIPGIKQNIFTTFIFLSMSILLQGENSQFSGAVFNPDTIPEKSRQVFYQHFENQKVFIFKQFHEHTVKIHATYLTIIQSISKYLQNT